MEDAKLAVFDVPPLGRSGLVSHLEQMYFLQHEARIFSLRSPREMYQGT